jgi:competence protein ComEC
LVTLALTSALAGTASAPYGAYHFGRIQLYFVVSNMVAVPVTAFWTMPAGLIALLLMPFGLERVALTPMGWGAALIIEIARVTAALPQATVAVPHAPAWGLAVLSLGIAWLGLWRSRLRLAGLALIGAGLASPAFVALPDMLVSDDAKLIALRTPAGVFVQSVQGASRFTREAWGEYWARPDMLALPANGAAADGLVDCTDRDCLLRPRPEAPAALLIRPGTAGPARCDAAALVVAAEPVRRVCRWDALLVDRFTVWREGAQAIWLGPGGVRIVTDREVRGDRPWVPPLVYPRRKPAAEGEPG